MQGTWLTNNSDLFKTLSQLQIKKNIRNLAMFVLFKKLVAKFKFYEI